MNCYRYCDLILTRDFRAGLYLADNKIIVDEVIEYVSDVGIAWLPLKNRINKELVDCYKQYRSSTYADYLFIGGATTNSHFLGPHNFWGYVPLNDSTIRLEMFGLHKLKNRQIGYSLEFVRDNRVFTLVTGAQACRFPLFCVEG